MKTLKEYTEANRKAWNEAMPKHQVVMKNKWDERFSQKGYFCQNDIELKRLNDLGIKGKDIAHLSCNNGAELMSLKNMGANRCVGFDISDEAIKEAKERCKLTGIECDFIRTDVLEITEDYYNQFDIVYITVGALVWIPDLEIYFAKAANLLKENGILFIYEHHPYANIFTWDENKNPLTVENHYFTDKVEEWTEGIDYYGFTKYDSSPSYEFSYTISSLINTVIGSGLAITGFEEFNKDIALCFGRIEEAGIKLPLSYILTAKKL